MSFALLQTALLLPLELAINGVLALDGASAARLQKLDGKSLAVRVTQPAFALFINVRGNRLQLAPIHEGAETASLQGTASALAGLLLRRAPVETLHGTNVELLGDTAFVQQLQALLRDLEIDWEYHLSKFVGDIPTQAAADSLRAAGSQLRKTGARLRDNLTEYLHEESGLLPNAEALEAFYRDVAELKLRADRLQARIDQFERRV